jgi:hypothetical protein
MITDRRTMTDRRKHPDGSECPLNHESVEKLLGTLDSIDHRLQKIERFMLIGHVVVWTIGIIVTAFWWMSENIEIFRSWANDFLRK